MPRPKTVPVAHYANGGKEVLKRQGGRWYWRTSAGGRASSGTLAAAIENIESQGGRVVRQASTAGAATFDLALTQALNKALFGGRR